MSQRRSKSHYAFKLTPAGARTHTMQSLKEGNRFKGAIVSVSECMARVSKTFNCCLLSLKKSQQLVRLFSVLQVQSS